MTFWRSDDNVLGAPGAGPLSHYTHGVNECWYKNERKSRALAAAMLSNMKTLITAFLSMVAFDATVGPIQRVEVTTQTLLKGIDVSANQKNIKWDTLPKDGVVFAYIKATEGKGKCVGALVVQDADVPF